MFRRQTGFTLLEILVSVSIIAVLTSILYLSFDDARNSSANKAMMTEFKEVQLALELYKAQNGSYPLPETTGTCGSGALIITSTDSTCTLPFITGLVPGFIAGLPAINESNNNNCEISYSTDSTGAWYKLTADECIAGNQNLTVDAELSRCPSTCASCAGGTMNAAYQASAPYAKSVAVYSLGGQCN